MGRRTIDKRLLSLVLLAICVLLVLALEVRRRRGLALQLAVAQLPLGITAADADARMGGTPDEVTAQPGVLMNPVTFLDATNSQAGAYGPAVNYQLRMWDQGGVRAVAVVGPDGRVAGRFSVEADWYWRTLRSLARSLVGGN